MLVATLEPLAPAARTDCGSLAALKLPHTSITVAQSVAPGAFTQPREKFDLTNGTYDKLPASCRLAGVLQPSADSNIRSEVWMPAQNDADHDVNLAMERWVEKGIQPDAIIAFRPLPAGIRTRPLCPFPKVARWKGQGSTDDAENFACVDSPSSAGSQEGERH
jgi:hypothetical protein